MYYNNNWNGWNGYSTPMWVNHQINSLPSYQPWNGYQGQMMTPALYPSAAAQTPEIQVPIQETSDGKKPIYPGYKIRMGDKGDIVKIIEQRLGLRPTGVFTPQVHEMVRRFQQDNRVEANGMVGTKTWEKMFGSSKAIGKYSVRNDTEKDAIVLWTAKKCKDSFYGIPNVCHYELLLPDQLQTYEFDEKTSNRRVGVLRKGSFRTLPISSGVPDGHEFSISSIRSSGVKLSRIPGRINNNGAHRKEFMNRMQAMMNGVVSGVKERLPFLY